MRLGPRCEYACARVSSPLLPPPPPPPPPPDSNSSPPSQPGAFFKLKSYEKAFKIMPWPAWGYLSTPFLIKIL